MRSSCLLGPALVAAVVPLACGRDDPAKVQPPPPPPVEVVAPTPASPDELLRRAAAVEAQVEGSKDRLAALRNAARAYGAVLKVDPSSRPAADAIARIAATPEVAARRAAIEHSVFDAAMRGDATVAAALLAELKDFEPQAEDLVVLPASGLVVRPQGAPQEAR